ncbi:MAG: glycosyltransferase family 2 protein [Actinomycetota bacterium]|nr:glycosyltransferase family 2 protein [Actinomycetota bacterium]
MARPENKRATRRKMGRDRRTPLPAVGSPATPMAIGRGRVAIAITLGAWALYAVPMLWNELTSPDGWRPARFAETLGYVTLVTLLTLSSTAYLLARHGALVRSRLHRRAPRGLIDQAMRARGDRSITALVPSYREDARVIRQTLLSVALQEFPSKRVVLLIDDPPVPDSDANRRILEEAQALPGEIEALLSGPAAEFTAALDTFCRTGTGDPDAVRALATHYRRAAGFIHGVRRDLEVTDHTDRFCRDSVLGGLQRDLEGAADALAAAADEGQTLGTEVMLQLHQRLAWTFTCELTSFQRKQYVNLSHEPNKAMNLNAYLGLMGGSYRVERSGRREALAECDPEHADVLIPYSDYVLTLDADSVLLPEYCLRLTHRLEQPAFADVAVIQTPYSAYPGGASRIERVAGATTDIQHILHQGLTYYDATFWVGANAILRRSALEDIVEIDNSGPWPVKRYIADRTVIEDTESSVDLVLSGWRLHNYQERLSYSATPPDFGSLCVQRQRWANGGLLIAPKLWSVIRKGGDPLGVLLRLNYTASIAWASLGLALLLVWPFDDRVLSPLVVAIAVPYFAAMASDLKRCGYKRTDIVRIYAFNLIMLPVNLTGTAKSLYQGLTGRKNAFTRTPKVKHRTTAPFWLVLFPYILIAGASYTTWRDLQTGAWGHAVFAGLNAFLGLYGLVAFIGIRDSLADMAVRAFESLRRDVDPNVVASEEQGWEEQLFYGSDGTGSASTRMPPRLAMAKPELFAPPEEQAAAAHESGQRRRAANVTGATSTAGTGEHTPEDVPIGRDELIEAIRASKRLLAAIEAGFDEGADAGGRNGDGRDPRLAAPVHRSGAGQTGSGG